ncbi:MAG: helix-turn-helix transcriptional regulator [Coprobacillus sp.]
MKSRIKELRSVLGLSQKDFADKLGLTDTAISKIEKGDRNPSEQTIKSVCREFNIDYFWLTEGKGDMFTSFPETIIDEVVNQFKLNKGDKAILQAYVNLSESKREAVKDFLLSIAENMKEESD